MKKLVQTLKNIWGIEELKSKILVTLLLVFVHTTGSVPISFYPESTPINCLASPVQKPVRSVSLTHFLEAPFQLPLFLRLGIMPYISASIFMQLMTILVPQMQKVQKEGESGRKKINQWTRYLTVSHVTASCQKLMLMWDT